MWMLLPLMLIPLAVQGFFWATNRGRFTVAEWVLQEAIMVVLLVVGFQAARYGAIADTELWNGHITAKNSGRQSCCHCHTVCDSKDEDGNCTSSHEVCDHNTDPWWNLKVSTGDTLAKTCSRSRSAPGWWTHAYIGEPASVPHSYTNYLLAKSYLSLGQTQEALAACRTALELSPENKTIASLLAELENDELQ